MPASRRRCVERLELSASSEKIHNVERLTRRSNKRPRRRIFPRGPRKKRGKKRGDRPCRRPKREEKCYPHLIFELILMYLEVKHLAIPSLSVISKTHNAEIFTFRDNFGSSGRDDNPKRSVFPSLSPQALRLISPEPRNSPACSRPYRD